MAQDDTSTFSLIPKKTVLWFLTMRFLSQVVTVAFSVTTTTVSGFSLHPQSLFRIQHDVVSQSSRTFSTTCTTTTALQAAATYGRGAEIWPECNEAGINLADSFPGGIIPAVTSASVESKETNPILLLDKTPAGIALVLLLTGLVRPMDVMIGAGIGGYLAILSYFAKAPRSDGISPHVPALPPQGHVPDVVLNPLGFVFTKSKEYDAWLKAGTVLSLLAPVAAICKYTLLSGSSATNQVVAARACARPLFLLCCQALVESLSRLVMAPLPLRILAPVLFNTVRLVPLWMWATTTTVSLGMMGRLLAVANLAYWSCNLFGFLLPTATMRYMRAYFLGVEAEQVTTRPGFENSVGLLS